MVGHSIASPPPSGNAAIAVIELRGGADAIDGVLASLGVGELAVGRTALRTVPDIDTLVLARPSPEQVWLFPHAGPVVLRRLTAALERCGAPASGPPAPTDFTGRLESALARAASPLGVDLLLEQPSRWANPPTADPMPPAHAAALRHLIDPPLILALGPPNIGKSSLLNTLAGRSVAIVADEPGTTRDHVGALIDFAGLTARYIDAPGIGPTPDNEHAPIDAAARALALDLVPEADLILLCGDAASGFLPFELGGRGGGRAEGRPFLRLALRADLGRPPETEYDLAVSIRESPRAGGGIEPLVARIRDTLVPPEALADPRPWPFWIGGAVEAFPKPQ